jgi:hypothetical protein
MAVNQALSLAPTFPWFNTVGSLKDKVYETTPHTLEELINTILIEISAISEEELQRVKNVFRSCPKRIRLGRHHFEHLLWHWWVFVRLSKGCYHSESSRFLHHLFTPPETRRMTQRWRNFGQVFIIQAGGKNTLYNYPNWFQESVEVKTTLL